MLVMEASRRSQFSRASAGENNSELKQAIEFALGAPFPYPFPVPAFQLRNELKLSRGRNGVV